MGVNVQTITWIAFWTFAKGKRLRKIVSNFPSYSGHQAQQVFFPIKKKIQLTEYVFVLFYEAYRWDT